MISESVREVAPSPSSLPGVDVAAERTDQSHQEHHDSHNIDGNNDSLATKNSEETKSARLRTTRARSSKYKGVSWCSRDRKWLVQITVDCKIVHLGYFRDEDEAACRYNEAALPLGKSLNIFNDPSATIPASSVQAKTKSSFSQDDGELELAASSSSSSTSSISSASTSQLMASIHDANGNADESTLKAELISSKVENIIEISKPPLSDVSSLSSFPSPRNYTETQRSSIHHSGPSQSTTPSAKDTTKRGQNKYAVVLILNGEIERICSSQVEAASFLNVYPSQICRAIVKGLVTQGRIIRRLADWSKDQEDNQRSRIGTAGMEEVDRVSCVSNDAADLPAETSRKGKLQRTDVDDIKKVELESESGNSDQNAPKEGLNSVPSFSAAAASKPRNQITTNNYSCNSFVDKQCRSPAVRTKGSSVFRGVHFDVSAQKWRARIRIGGKLLDLGLFDSESTAAQKYDVQAAIAGRPMNFPPKAGDKMELDGEGAGIEIENSRTLGDHSDGNEDIQEANGSKSEQAAEFPNAIAKKPKRQRKASPRQDLVGKARKTATALEKSAVSIYLFAHGSSGWDEGQPAGEGRVTKLSSDTLLSLEKLSSAHPSKKKSRR